jgi:uncharacterized OB-fold protein
MSDVGVTEPMGASSPPIPGDHPLHRFYWEAVRNHQLQLLRCDGCRHFVHYPRPICPRCGSTSLTPTPISGRGTLYSYTVVMQAGHPYFVDKIPYVIGVVEIEEEVGVRMPAGIEGTEEELRCGTPMEVVFRDVTESLVLPFFRPRSTTDPA